MRMPYRIAFSADPFDQWRLSQAGGVIKRVGKREMFVFGSEQQYRRYQELNSKRKK